MDSDTDSECTDIVSISTTIQNVLQVYKRDVKSIVDIQIPRVNVHQVRKQFRQFFQKETQQIFSFLDSPITLSPTLLVTRQFLQKYGHSAFHNSRVKIRD